MKIFTSFLVFFFSIFAAFSQGYFYEYNVTMSSGSGTMSFYCKDGNIRSVLSVSTPYKGDLNIVRLLLKARPDTLYQLSSDNKMYAEVDISSDVKWKDHSQPDYIVKVVGEDTINGYKTVHATVQLPKAEEQTHLWLTTDIPYYEELITYKSPITSKKNMYAALKEIGVIGFPVKVTSFDDDEPITLLLSNVKASDLPESLFSMDGYSKILSVKENSAVEINDQLIEKMQENTKAK